MRQSPLPESPASAEFALSLVVPTYCRPDHLDKCLESIAKEIGTSPAVEVIVVDNGPDQDGQAVTLRWQQSVSQLRYVHEPMTGLSHARNRGWMEARGGYVAYVDDDCRLLPGWAEAALRLAVSGQASIFGGPYFACYESPKPVWFRDSYASHDQGNVPRPLNDDEYLDGGNFAILQALIQAMGGFDPQWGVVGRKREYAEETILQRLARERFPSVVVFYEPDMRVGHVVRPEKMSFRWMARFAYDMGRYAYLSGPEPILPRTKRKILTEAAVCLWGLLRDLERGFRRDRSRYEYYENFMIEWGFRHLRKLGILREQLRRPHHRKHDGSL